MTFRRISPLVALAFFAAQVATCVCAASMERVVEAAGSKPAHSCCATHKESKSKPVAPARKECCCSDASHTALVDETVTPVRAPEIEAPVTDEVVPVALTTVPAPFEGPPGRGPDVRLYTLHRSLLI